MWKLYAQDPIVQPDFDPIYHRTAHQPKIAYTYIILLNKRAREEERRTVFHMVRQSERDALIKTTQNCIA